MEDGDEVEEAQEEGEEEEGEEGVAFPPRHGRKRKPCCYHRIDELATPPRRIFLALWNQHAYHLPKEKVRSLKQILQQLYAMTPEETTKYFDELRAEVQAAKLRKKLKNKLRKYLLCRFHERQRKKAYRLFRRLLKCGISYAAKNPVPPVISIRLRYLSDIILEQLSFLRGLDMPDRENPDRQGVFLISVADWMAIAIERLYYAAQLTMKEITEQEETLDGLQTYDEFGHPIASSTPQRISLDPQTTQVPTTYSGMGQPAASSTPRNLSLDPQNTTQVPKTYSGMGQPAGSSTPKKLLLNQQNTTQVPKTYSGMGQPAGSSTPKKLSLDPQNTTQVPKTYSGMGQPAGSSTPNKLSLDPGAQQSPKDTSLYPYYSILEETKPSKAPPKKRKSKTKVPFYNFKQLQSKYPFSPQPVKSKLEIPLFRLEKRPVPVKVPEETFVIKGKSKTKQSFKHDGTTYRISSIQN